MFDLATLRKGKEKLPPRIVLYGPHGIGKSTFANDAGSVFIPTEDGLGQIDVTNGSFPLCKTLEEFHGAIDSLLEQDHEIPAVCVDSIDWAETLIHKQIIDKENKSSMEECCGGYGKAYKVAQEQWFKILAKLDRLRKEKKMIVILLAHCKVVEYQNPMGDNFDRYVLDLHTSKSVNIPAKIMEWADAVLFVDYKTLTDEGKGKGAGKRVLYTEERPPFLAKNRFNLEPKMDFNWNQLLERI